MAGSPARKLASTALQQWRSTHQFADKIIQDLLASSSAAASEKAFAQELFYGVLRNLTLLDFYISQLRDRPLDALSRDLIRLGLFQLLHLHIPTHAAVFETVHLAPVSRRSIVNAILRNAVRGLDRLLQARATRPLYVRESHPRFLVDRWRKAFDQKSALDLCQWDNQPAPVYARIHSSRISPETFLRRNPGTHSVAFHPLFVRCDIVPHDALARGECYIQDPSTALAIELLDPQPGDKILDACAAPGGKTFQIADATADKARVLACDRDGGRIELLRENLNRLNLTNVTVLQNDWLKDSASERLRSEKFDKILVDAPCTNTGVMRRRVDVRWRLTPTDFENMAERQFRIVAAVLPLLRAGGVLVYSTCSLEPEENEQVAARIRREFPKLGYEKTVSLLPFRDHVDGAFASRFIATG